MTIAIAVESLVFGTARCRSFPIRRTLPTEETITDCDKWEILCTLYCAKLVLRR